MIPLDISSLEKALASLREVWLEHQREPQNRFVKDSVVKRFEYSYELAHKMLKRFLVISEFSADTVNEMTFFDIVRAGNIKGLLQGDVEDWNEYRAMRNTTCHTYDESKAEQVLAVVAKFMDETDYLTKQLKSRIERNE